MPDTALVMGPDGKPLNDAQGNQVMAKVGSFKPESPQPAPASGEKRWTETDENGPKVEHVEVEPTVPAAQLTDRCGDRQTRVLLAPALMEGT